MPFRSPQQREYLRIHEPEVYRRWMRRYGPKPRPSSLGERLRRVPKRRGR